MEEENRVQALHNLGILDTDFSKRFDRITRMAQIILQVPIVLISLVDTDRQWFKSCQGLTVRENPR